ncbi:MAG TPA: DNAase [Oceanospirillaceae bacterium]|nr:DNAase [Oceanospirillaceae bacterium]
MSQAQGVQREAIFDSHCHWDHPKLQALQPELWQHCQQQGVADLLVPATVAEHWPQLISLCQQNPHWHLTLGLHPYFLSQYQAADLSLLEQLVAQAQPIAIGEIGLDWHLPADTWEQQEVLFLAQLKLAQAAQLPVVLHVRKCHDRVIKLLRQVRFAQGGFVHAYSGNEQQAHAYHSQGFKLGVGGSITYTRATKTRRLFAALPLAYLVLETDAPDMPMAHQEDRLNRPDDLPKVLHVMSELREEDVATIAQQTTANVRSVLRLT